MQEDTVIGNYVPRAMEVSQVTLLFRGEVLRNEGTEQEFGKARKKKNKRKNGPAVYLTASAPTSPPSGQRALVQWLLVAVTTPAGRGRWFCVSPGNEQNDFTRSGNATLLGADVVN